MTDGLVVADERLEVRRRSALQNLTELENVENARFVSGRWIGTVDYLLHLSLNLTTTNDVLFHLGHVGRKYLSYSKPEQTGRSDTMRMRGQP